VRSPGKRAERAAPAERRKPLPAVPSPGVAIKMSPLLLAPELPLGEGFQRIIGGCLGHLAANRELLGEPGVEAVHQMRVAVRRLRSACALFEPGIPHQRPLVLQEELRWLARCLGRVRDWDVLLTRTLPLVAEARTADLLQARAEGRRTIDRRSLERELSGRRFIALLRGLESLAAEIAAEADSKRLYEAAPSLLSRLDRRVHRAGQDFRQLTAKERHELRKKLRKLHYGADFLASLFPRRQVERFVKRTSRLQDLLGELNDVTASARLLKQIGRGLPAGWRAFASQGPALKSLRRSWRRFRKADRFWV
jgi:triphosphatase